jgi:hypothetical protein
MIGSPNATVFMTENGNFGRENATKTWHRPRFRAICKQRLLAGLFDPSRFEVGQNLNAGEIVQPSSNSSTTSSDTSSINSVNHIARYLAGVDFSTFYEDWNGTLPFKRVELEANALARYLFLNEAMYNSSSQLFNTVGDGVRGYAGVDLKLYVRQNTGARYGIKMTCAFGSLPPTFARVKTFQVRVPHAPYTHGAPRHHQGRQAGTSLGTTLR